jgi:hypothetical protein
LSALKGEPTPGAFVQLGERGGYTLPGGPAKAPTGTLEELDAMRQAINADIRDAKAAPNADVRLRNLGQVHKALDEAVFKSNLPQETKDLYGKALNTYRGPEGFVDRFKTGFIPDMLKNTFRNEPKLLPDNVMPTVLSNETRAGDFIRAADTELKPYYSRYSSADAVSGQPGDPNYTALLIGLGVDELSMAPPLIPAARYVLRSLKLTEAKQLAQLALAMESPAAIHALCARFAEERLRS